MQVVAGSMIASVKSSLMLPLVTFSSIRAGTTQRPCRSALPLEHWILIRSFGAGGGVTPSPAARAVGRSVMRVASSS